MQPKPSSKLYRRVRRFESLTTTARRLAWLASPALLLAAAHGQDALFSSVALDQSIAARPAQPVGPHLGPVQFALGGYAGATYDDNINASQIATESDYISRAGIQLNLNWLATENSDLQLGTGLGIFITRNTQPITGIEINPNSSSPTPSRWTRSH